MSVEKWKAINFIISENINSNISEQLPELIKRNLIDNYREETIDSVLVDIEI